MGEVKRYKFHQIFDHDQSKYVTAMSGYAEGSHVLHSDYATLEAERDALAAEVMLYRNKMGRIAIALFGDQNNVTDEACIERAANVVEELADTNGLFQDAITLAQMNEDRLDVAEAEAAKVKAHATVSLNEWSDAMEEASATIDKLSAAAAQMRAALYDCASGLRYIRETHGEPYGVGMGRAIANADLALSTDAGKGYVDASGAVERTVSLHDGCAWVDAILPDDWAGLPVKIVKVKP